MIGCQSKTTPSVDPKISTELECKWYTSLRQSNISDEDIDHTPDSVIVHIYINEKGYEKCLNRNK